LLRHVEQALSQRYVDVRLESFEDNEKANTFYRQNGWREVSRYFDTDSGVNKLVFQKKARAEPEAAPDRGRMSVNPAS
jgi:ribosomal protein S18 acetylase RimI-like enzyme